MSAVDSSAAVRGGVLLHNAGVAARVLAVATRRGVGVWRAAKAGGVGAASDGCFARVMCRYGPRVERCAAISDHGLFALLSRARMKT